MPGTEETDADRAPGRLVPAGTLSADEAIAVRLDEMDRAHGIMCRVQATGSPIRRTRQQGPGTVPQNVRPRSLPIVRQQWFTVLPSWHDRAAGEETAGGTVGENFPHRRANPSAWAWG